MFLPIEKLIWDHTAFDNNYRDIMPLVESIREHGILETSFVQVTPKGDYYLVIAGRDFARAVCMLGYKQINCHVRYFDNDIERLMSQVKEIEWKPGYREGRNYHAYRAGY